MLLVAAAGKEDKEYVAEFCGFLLLASILLNPQKTVA